MCDRSVPCAKVSVCFRCERQNGIEVIGFLAIFSVQIVTIGIQFDFFVCLFLFGIAVAPQKKKQMDLDWLVQ